MKPSSLIVLGGGAAGFFAAIHAARANPDASVLILEGSRKPLSKVLISGGGRCNVTNDTQDPTELLKNYPRGSRELRGPIRRFGVTETIEWFRAEGVKLVTEADRRMFPSTNSSETIANCLTRAAKQAGVAIELGQKVTTIRRVDEGFVLRTLSGKEFQSTALIVTTGGSKQGYELISRLGHTIVPPMPSLFTFAIESPLLADLAGVSFPATTLQLTVGDQRFTRKGPTLITHWGLSGPATIQLSAFAARELYQANYQAELQVSFVDDLNQEQVLAELKVLRESSGQKQIENHSQYGLPRRFWTRLCQQTELTTPKRWNEAPNKALQQLAELLTRAKLPITGKGIFKEEFVTSGGVSLKEVDFKTMHSKLIPNLAFAGEVLNIDGITGGFNFQSAWTTGWISGHNIITPTSSRTTRANPDPPPASSRRTR